MYLFVYLFFSSFYSLFNPFRIPNKKTWTWVHFNILWAYFLCKGFYIRIISRIFIWILIRKKNMFFLSLLHLSKWWSSFHLNPQFPYFNLMNMHEVYHIVSNEMWKIPNAKKTRRFVIGFLCTMFFLFEAETGISAWTKQGSDRNDFECHLCNVNGTNDNRRAVKRHRCSKFYVLSVRAQHGKALVHTKHLDIVWVNFQNEESRRTSAKEKLSNVDTLTIQTAGH